MNQWFRINGYPFSRVETMQLELSWSGVREEGYIDRTAKILSSALKTLMESGNSFRFALCGLLSLKPSLFSH
jgi:hypothetical protein